MPSPLQLTATARMMLYDTSGNKVSCIQLPVAIRSQVKEPKYTPEAGATTKKTSPAAAKPRT